MKLEIERIPILIVGGSRAYGLHTKTSDVDLKGIYIPELKYYTGFLNKFEQAEGTPHMEAFIQLMNSEEKQAIAQEKVEGTIYELSKFMCLAAESNPNILDVLFCRDQEIRAMNVLGEQLRAEAHKFLSRKAKFTFSGYAISQLKRIKTHRRWLMNSPKAPPARKDYDLPECTLIPADQLAAAQAAIRSQIDTWELDFGDMSPDRVIHIQERMTKYMEEVCSYLGFPSVDDGKWLAAARAVGLNDNLIYVLQKEREYDAGIREWKSYLTWKTNRNQARAQLEEKHGYDTKHGMHLVRLLRMGKEILTTGKVNVWRGDIDREELLAIRNQGIWSYDQLTSWAEEQDQLLNALYRDPQYLQILQAKPNREYLDSLCREFIENQNIKKG